MKPKIVAILGPTGVGKSKMGIEIAQKFNGEIISADSVQIYKEFDIGSAKIKSSETCGIKHYAIDIVSPNENFSAFDFVNYSKTRINQILEKGKTPIIVGGTALYIKALFENYNLGGEKDEKLRAELENELKEFGLEFLVNKLKNLAPEKAKEIDLKNPVRVIRAIEIALSDNVKTKSESEYDYKIFALNRNREVLYNKINERVEEMFSQGLEDEVKTLFNKYGEGVQPFKAIGYKEFIPFFKGEYTLEKVKELIKQHSRNYAKRQLTFIRGMKDCIWIDVENYDFAKKQIIGELKKWLI